jgi:dienelactone hydrolase
VVSGIDFMLSPANPYLKDTKTDSIGIAGWSLGGRVLSRTQEEDLRIDALVAWDNLAVSETGDDGSPLCRNQPQVIRKARVPALGQSSDGCFGKSAEAKKTAFEHWRASKTPAMQVVFKGANHFFWSARARESQHEIAHYYTLAWFDRWLKGDRSASERLLARTVLGNGLENLLSSTYHSGAFFDGYDCNDLREPCRKK